MTRSAKQRRRRDELVAAMRRVARDRGLAGANVRAVAEAADVSPGSVFYYFPTMQDLQLAAVDGVLEEFHRARIGIVEGPGTAAERLRAMILAGVPDVISDDLRLVYGSLPHLQEKPEFRPLHRAIVERQVMLYRTLIEIGRATGEFEPRGDVGRIARNLVALEDAYDLYAIISDEFSRVESRAAMFDYVAAALGAALEPLEPADA